MSHRAQASADRKESNAADGQKHKDAKEKIPAKQYAARGAQVWTHYKILAFALKDFILSS